MLKFWKDDNTFQKSINSRPENKHWAFVDGPPFVTGMPHYGSLLSSLPKDLFGRYWTMKGYRVRRVWGWDGHGLPIENKVEAKLNITRKKDIEEKIGVAKFIEECQKYVNEISDEWEWYIDHIGRWVDFKQAYKTWETSYMESVMWVFKQMYDKGYIYKGLRVALYCPHCATPISNFEVAMDADNYKEVPDSATTYKYKLKDEENTYILAWSTTPWNKIVTPALAVNPELDYVKVQQNGENYILAKSTIKMLTGEYKELETYKGKDLVGKKFEPHYDYYKIGDGKKAFVVIPGDFVTADEGTGVVTIAAYGEEDLKAMQAENIHIEMHVDEEGTIKPEVPKFGGLYYLKANKAVNEDLAKRGLIYKDETLPHNVPLCWRCHTRLYYAPQDAWYVDVQRLKPLLKKTNEKVNWIPDHFKFGRFLKSMESAPDWNISRSRYWGSPVPVWECQCGERFVPGSIKELEEASGEKIADLHKPEIDEIAISCKKCGQKVKRVPEVLDSWIEAGSAAFAERHFPFDKQWKLEDFFPPDFIAEYTGQIRAWFYVLHVIGGALYESPAFKNVLVHGVILGTDGRKMSKNYGNYPDPKEMLAKYGGDALRLYLLGSPVMNGEDILISEDQYKQQVKGMMLILWNVYNYFVTYANLDGWDKNKANEKSQNILDKWIISRVNGLLQEVTVSLEKFNTVTTIDEIQKFVDDFSTWYIRRSRDRSDKDNFYSTTYSVLVMLCKIIAPIMPFMAEALFTNLTEEESVHLSTWLEADTNLIDKKLEEEMRAARAMVAEGHSKRKADQSPIKKPLEKLEWESAQGGADSVRSEIWDTVLEELNIFNIVINGKQVYPAQFAAKTIEELEALEKKRDIIRKIQQERKSLGTSYDEKVDVILPDWPKEFEEEIKRKALINNLSKGDTFSVKKI